LRATSSLGIRCADAELQFEKADAELQRSIAIVSPDQEHEMQVRIRQFEWERKQVQAQDRVKRLEALERSADELEASSRKIEILRNEIQKKLSVMFPQVTEDERGVVVTVPEKSWSRTERELNHFVEIMRSYPSSKVVVDVSRPGRNSLQNQLATRNSAKAIADNLSARGIPAQNIGFTGTVEEGPALNRIIVAP
jgi:hypothetical protein